MPNYGEATYWDERYARDGDDPFDWLFSFDELKEILETLLPDKSIKTLLVGAGNAPFSPELHQKGGYENLTNIDISQVVIDQQKEKYPKQQWEVMDVTHMTFEDGSFPAVIDKSLIDTLLCCNNSAKRVTSMLREIHRVLSPLGGRFITFSLHSIEEILSKFRSLDWDVHAYRVQSSRWNEGEHRKRAVAHSMIVCDKGARKDSPSLDTLLSPLPAILSEASYISLKSYADNVNFTYGLQHAPPAQVSYLLLRATYQVPPYTAEGDKELRISRVRELPKSVKAYSEEEETRFRDLEEVKGYVQGQIGGLERRLVKLLKNSAEFTFNHNKQMKGEEKGGKKKGKGKRKGGKGKVKGDEMSVELKGKLDHSIRSL